MHLWAIERPHVVALHAFLAKPAYFFDLHEVAERQSLAIVRVAELLPTVHLPRQTAKYKTHVLVIAAGKDHPGPLFRGQPFKQKCIKIAYAGFGHAAVVNALPAGALHGDHAGVGAFCFLGSGGQHTLVVDAMFCRF